MAGKFIRTSNMKQTMPDLLADNVKGIINNPILSYKNVTLERIAIKYPILKDECERQKYNINITTIVSEETH